MGLFSHSKLIVGFDLGDEFSQISYSTGGEEVETLSQTAGEENYNIPTVLCKRRGVNQWSYGMEAVRNGAEDQGIPVKNLVELAREGEPVLVDGNAFDPVALLTLFMKRCLGMLTQISSPEKMTALMITCGALDHRMVEILTRVTEGLHLKNTRICFQSHQESFFHYVIKQPQELFRQQVLLLEYTGTRVVAYCMECNRRTTPVVSFIENWEYNMPPYEPMPEEEALRKDKMERLDTEFAGIASQVVKRTMVSCVYLIGENYSEEWMKESLRILCMGRRVFQGDNLYSKGACYAMSERLQPTETGKSYVFLGEDKLKSNVGMKVFDRGKETYLALLDAGVNWYEAKQGFEFYARGGNELELQVISLIGGEGRTVSVTLEDMLPGMSRMRAVLYLTGEKELVLEVEDLGFGEFRPATHQKWKKQIAL